MASADDAGKNDCADQVDLAHESLLRLDPTGKPYWARLRRWVEENRKRLQDRGDLEVLADQWVKQGSPRLSGLATRRQLGDFGRVKGARDPAPAYLRASRSRRRLMGGPWLVAAVAVLSLVNAWWIEKADMSFRDEMSAVRFNLYVRGRALAGWIEEPEMVPIDGGTFEMGCISEKSCEPNEVPVRDVEVRTFAMGRTEVTFDQYDLFALANGRDLPDDQDWGRGNRPVINVSWNDAAAYAHCLKE